ncbi:MAG: ATP-binding protein [Calothrix sp. SM1_5_4]|nr:ATP-binding protein [Calothrix sp. SM1_5_4]
MTLSQVRNRLSELGFTGMLMNCEAVLTKLQSGEIHALEALDELLEREWRYRQERATVTRVRRSKIRKGASLEEFDFSFGRGITKAELRNLASLEWCDQGKPLILIGPTGIGKTYIARSLGLLACEKGKTSLFMTVTDFLEHQAIARNTNTYLKFRERLTRPDLLIIDDFGMRKFTAQEAEDLRDVIEHRSYGKSTLITTQLPVDHWGEVIGDEIILDGLVDRIEPPGLSIKFKGPSFRPKLKKTVDDLGQKN